MSTGLQTSDRNAFIIAQEIITIKDQAGKIFLQSALEIGKRLKEAKEIVGHGNWSKWLEESVDYSQRTASNLMKLYEEYGSIYLENSNSQSIANLGYTQALAMLKLDLEDRENLLENNDVSSMSVKDIEKVAEELRKEKDAKAELQKLFDQISNDNKSLITKLQEQEDLQKKFDELKKADASPDKLKQLEKTLESKNKEIAKLQKDLKRANDIEPVQITKEVIPKETVEELAKLHRKVEMGDNAAKFKAQLDVIVQTTNAMLETLEAIKAKDEALYSTYKEAFNKMLNKLKQE